MLLMISPLLRLFPLNMHSDVYSLIKIQRNHAKYTQ